jgi:hypothetical protein
MANPYKNTGRAGSSSPANNILVKAALKGLQKGAKAAKPAKKMVMQNIPVIKTAVKKQAYSIKNAARDAVTGLLGYAYGKSRNAKNTVKKVVHETGKSTRPPRSGAGM